MKVFVKIVDPKGQVKNYPIGETPIKIGRNLSAKIFVEDDQCSAAHAMLYTKNDSLYVEDLNSKNGTYLNGIRIFKQRVCLGDDLKLGQTGIQIDEKKNEPEILDKLKRNGTEITLNLEKREEIQREVRIKNAAARDFAASSKLYHGNSPRIKKSSPSSFESVKEAAALVLDIVFSLVIFFTAFGLLESNFPMAVEGMKNKALSAYFQGDMIYITMSSVIAAILSFFINRGNGERLSLGEKIVGMD